MRMDQVYLGCLCLLPQRRTAAKANPTRCGFLCMSDPGIQPDRLPIRPFRYAEHGDRVAGLGQEAHIGRHTLDRTSLCRPGVRNEMSDVWQGTTGRNADTLKS